MPKLNLQTECDFVISEIKAQKKQKNNPIKNQFLKIFQALIVEIINERDKTKEQAREKIYFKTKKFYLANKQKSSI